MHSCGCNLNVGECCRVHENAVECMPIYVNFYYFIACTNNNNRDIIDQFQLIPRENYLSVRDWNSFMMRRKTVYIQSMNLLPTVIRSYQRLWVTRLPYCLQTGLNFIQNSRKFK